MAFLFLSHIVISNISVETSRGSNISQKDIQKLEASPTSAPLRMNVEVIAPASLLLLWNSYCSTGLQNSYGYGSWLDREHFDRESS